MPDEELTHWYPDLYPRQLETMAACVPSLHNFILLNGPRWASKTYVCHHAVCQHAWHTDRGNICLLTFTQSVGIDSGVWQHLTEVFLPEWIDAGFGMKWVREPYIQGVTKKPACEVSNKWGNKTRISLESLRNEDEVEARFKGKGYSMIWINELSKFKHRKTFDTLKQQLRMPHLKSEDHLFLADTNPDLELGAQSWIYQLWYEFRTADRDTLIRMHPNTPPEKLEPLQRALKLIEFSVDDNLSLTEEKKAQLMADFIHDDDLLAAYFYGKWVTASSDALFFKAFRPSVHVVGDLESASNPEPEILVPKETTYELILGMDPGAVNCASCIMEKRLEILEPPTAQASKEKTEPKAVPVVSTLDELIVIGQDFDLTEYVQELVEKMEFWEGQLSDPHRVVWRMWSDRSVFDMKIPFSDRLWHQAIYAASGGKIDLIAAERGKGSVKARIDLTRKLLFQNRAFFSKTYCPQTIEMMKSIRRGKAITELISRGSKFKHAFDAWSYAVASEFYEELEAESYGVMHQMRKMRKGKDSGLVLVPL